MIFLYTICFSFVISSVMYRDANFVSADVFTSIEKMREIFFHEKRFLSGIRRALENLEATPDIQAVLIFCQKRQEEMKKENIRESVVDIKHPNGVYLMIKHFADVYKDVRSNIERMKNIPYLNWVLQNMPFSKDLQGARKSLLRLQDVYNISSRDMADGNYSGFHGPPLDVLDTFHIGLTALEDEQYRLSIEWFNTTRTNLLLNQGKMEPSMESVVYFLQEAQKKWQAIKAKKDPSSIGLKKLKLSSLLRALNAKSPKEYTEEVLDNEKKKVHSLCAKMNQKYPKIPGPNDICRYRSMLVPYYLIGEEILSRNPFVSVIYNITNEKESTAIRRQASRQLFRAEVYDIQGSNQSDYRTSHVTFMGETDSKHLASVTTRIGRLANLNCVADSHDHWNQQSAGEKYQIVNYGIGGHYSVHMDTYEMSFTDSQSVLKNSGNRIATVLIYLTHVEVGGSTVFPWLDVAVPPLQHSALFWYNIDTSGTIDFRTRHAGCPVVVGDKWVMNKWILSHANTFTRPCELNKTTNSRLIEELTKGRPAQYRKTFPSY